MTFYWIGVLSNISLVSIIMFFASLFCLLLFLAMLIAEKNELARYRKDLLKCQNNISCTQKDIDYNTGLIENHENIEKWISKLVVISAIIFVISALLLIFVPTEATMLKILGM